VAVEHPFSFQVVGHKGSGVDGYNIDGSQYILFNNCAVDGSGRYGYYVDNSGGVNPNGVTLVDVEPSQILTTTYILKICQL
jgi:hypothetical protein